MKLYNKLLTLCASVMVAAMWACSSTVNEEMETMQGETRTAKVRTHSGDATLHYPLTLYAFNNVNGNLVTSYIAESENDNPQVVLSEGNYKLIAMAGTGSLNLPIQPTLQSGVGIPTHGTMMEALQVGRADVTIGKQDAEVEISMSYQVAQVDLTLKDIPNDVTDVNVSFSTLYADLTFDGTTGGTKTVTLNLTEDDSEAGTWTAPTTYVMPGQSTQLTLTISLTNATTSKVYGYTHSANLKAGTPYALTGSYKGMFTVSGIVSSAGWAASENIGFTFGPGVSEEGETENTPEQGELENNDEENNDENPTENGSYTVDALPNAKQIWNGHYVVAKVTADAASAELLLMSLKEFETTTINATTIASSYTESDMTDWRIPTEAGLKNISKTVGSTYQIATTNSTLTAAGGDALSSTQNYLCEDATKRIVMGTDTSLSTNTNDTYRLRLVKTVHVTLSK